MLSQNLSFPFLPSYQKKKKKKKVQCQVMFENQQFLSPPRRVSQSLLYFYSWAIFCVHPTIGLPFIVSFFFDSYVCVPFVLSKGADPTFDWAVPSMPVSRMGSLAKVILCRTHLSLVHLALCILWWLQDCVWGLVFLWSWVEEGGERKKGRLRFLRVLFFNNEKTHLNALEFHPYFCFAMNTLKFVVMINNQNKWEWSARVSNACQICFFFVLFCFVLLLLWFYTFMSVSWSPFCIHLFCGRLKNYPPFSLLRLPLPRKGHKGYNCSQHKTPFPLYTTHNCPSSILIPSITLTLPLNLNLTLTLNLYLITTLTLAQILTLIVTLTLMPFKRVLPEHGIFESSS